MSVDIDQTKNCEGISYTFRKASFSKFSKQQEFDLTLKDAVDAILIGTNVSNAQILKYPENITQTAKLILNNVPDSRGAIFASTNKDKSTQDKSCIEAAKMGAALVLTSNADVANQVIALQNECGVILCQNIKDNLRDPIVRSLRPLAEKVRSNFAIPVLSISGTSGKTTTRDLATSILRAANLNFNGTRNNDNNIWGTTLSVLDLNASHDCAIYEYGTDGPNQTALLARLTKPTITYTSSIGIAHLEGIRDIDQMLACETEQYDWMIENSSEPSFFLANMDDPILADYFNRRQNELSQAGNIFTISSIPGKNCDFQLVDFLEFAENDKFFSKVSIQTPYGVVNAIVPLIGRHNHANICGAVALAMVSGLCTTDDVCSGLQNPTFTGYRSEFFRDPISNALILNDSFNSNPTGLVASIKMALEAKNLMRDQITKVILVLGDMNELGESSLDYHIQLGQFARTNNVDQILCHGKYASGYARGYGGQTLQFDNKESLYEELRRTVLADSEQAKKTLILIKGSGKTKTSQISDWIREGNITTTSNF